MPNIEPVKGSTIVDSFHDIEKDREIIRHQETPRNPINGGIKDDSARNVAIAGGALTRINENPTNSSNNSDIPNAENV